MTTGRTGRAPGSRLAGLGALVGIGLALLAPSAGAMATTQSTSITASTVASGCPAPTTAPAPSTAAIDLSAVVIASGVAGPVCTGGGTPSVGGGGTVNRAASNGAGAAASVAPAVVKTAAASDEFDLGGVLYVGGLNSGYTPSLDPLAGELQLWFTVRNVSKSTIDASADFWMSGPFGNRLGEADGVKVAALKPGETRTVSAEVSGVGQWGLVSAHVKLTPPKTVDDATLSPVTRDASVFAPPWFVGFVAALVLGFAAVRTILQRARVPMLVGGTA
ncbi:hypothetical protein [Agromyces allii]|uniref:DUF916 domain-containing protein n=1 Tax=Agromyces allii TaxID=393607 RepID=A0ABN2QM21_9MICO|nr:hypothetical protein [Agromyces allii]